ncbi:hypothetical protein QBC38DRAFT_513172 [Podospora fimiseda]|uniref:LPXTG-motif cell wall anchor domain protein n=1 Tax=Podospora fimiseda TaxID=252190 RepID=A0AAN6YQ92_9PEZI|nr:hypothetical protein QBC38DRAFT_513172 [Podospora fimiseda]
MNECAGRVENRVTNPIPSPDNLNPPNINNTNTRSNPNLSSSFHTTTNDTNSLFVHRQNHNSSKLPAFRFADLKREPITVPSLLLQRIPPAAAAAVPSPSGPLSGASSAEKENGQQSAHDDQSQKTQQSQQQSHQSQLSQSQQIRKIPETPLHHFSSAQNISSEKAFAFETHAQNSQNSQIPGAVSRTKSLKFQFTAGGPSPANLSTGSKRPASFSDSPRPIGSAYATRSQSSNIAIPVTKRRITTTTTSSVAHAEADQEPDDPTLVPDSATKEWALGQRELLRSKTIDSSKTDEKKRSRPPPSYKQPSALATPTAASNNIDAASAGSTVSTSTPERRSGITQARSFRSAGPRKSVVVLEMPSKRVAESSYGEEISNSNPRDRALRSLEGRNRDDASPLSPHDIGDMTTSTDNDNTADIFMRIAGEATTRRTPEGSNSTSNKGKGEDSSAISRISRISHRRPLSTAIASFQPTSPPPIARRLSDQRENTRSRPRAESQTAQHMTRELAYRTSTREKPAPIMTNSEDQTTTRTVSIRTPLKPSPITPRTIQFQENLSESASAYQRRRQSITENNNLANGRTSQYRASNLSQSRIYNSSPLVPKAMTLQKDEPVLSSEASPPPAAEGDGSSSSTAAPSTVWDELDDLKSRIHRLELTGKMPATSGAAMSRTSDDRPPTATTNATTMSGSPKRGSGAGAAQADATSTTSSHREAPSQLLSALIKVKTLVGAEVFTALDAAANDALALASMMGSVGQPGPISSGASSIGVNGGVTDRQLRRKADNVCRSLTELCIALADELGGPNRPSQSSSAPTRQAAAASRRPSAIADTITIPSKSPRAPTSLEQKRQSLLASSVIGTPRYSAVPATPVEPLSAGRKSSLLLGRSRRAGTEEPEESGRRSSLLLRTRRAGTEEPEDTREGRKTSLLYHSRKSINEVEDEDVRFRAPSRAITEVNSFRTSVRDLSGAAGAASHNPISPQDGSSPLSSALPRRRLVPSSLNPRLSASTTSINGPTTPIPRRYLDRGTPDRENLGGASSIAEERASRQLSLSQTAMLNRTNSLSSRRNRDKGPHIP